MMNQLVITCALCVLFGVDPANGKDDAPRSEKQRLELTRPELLRIILQGEEIEPGRVFSQLSHERSNTMLTLVEIVNSKRTDRVAERNRLLAIGLLGEHRSGQGVTCLLTHLEAKTNVVLNPDSLELYPAAKALREIGEPAIYQIQFFIAQELSDKQLVLLAHVIHGAGGKEVGQYRLEMMLRDYVEQRRARAERDGTEFRPDQKIKNLERMIELFKTLDFRDRVR